MNSQMCKTTKYFPNYSDSSGFQCLITSLLQRSHSHWHTHLSIVIKYMLNSCQSSMLNSIKTHFYEELHILPDIFPTAIKFRDNEAL